VCANPNSVNKAERGRLLKGKRGTLENSFLVLFAGEREGGGEGGRSVEVFEVQQVSSIDVNVCMCRCDVAVRAVVHAATLV
jgi:hypothetical protein